MICDHGDGGVGNRGRQRACIREGRVARIEAEVRRHGRRRIMAKLAAMRFDRDLAKEVVQELFGETDEAELLEI